MFPTSTSLRLYYLDQTTFVKGAYNVCVPWGRQLVLSEINRCYVLLWITLHFFLENANVKNSEEQQRAAQSQPTKHRKTLASHPVPGTPEPWVWENEPQPGGNKTLSKWIWETANENGSHLISASISKSRAMVFFLGSLWNISFTLGHYLWEETMPD